MSEVLPSMEELLDRAYQQGRADERDRIRDILKDELESGYLIEKLLRKVYANV